MSSHNAKAKFQREIHTRKGDTVVLYTFLECSDPDCGKTLVYSQESDLNLDEAGFCAKEEIKECRMHFLMNLSSIRKMPVSRVERVCVDPEPCEAWNSNDLIKAMGGMSDER